MSTPEQMAGSVNAAVVGGCYAQRRTTTTNWNILTKEEQANKVRYEMSSKKRYGCADIHI